LPFSFVVDFLFEFFFCALEHFFFNPDHLTTKNVSLSQLNDALHRPATADREREKADLVSILKKEKEEADFCWPYRNSLPLFLSLFFLSFTSTPFLSDFGFFPCVFSPSL